MKALIAYITQPSSLELLREHGFVGFDESGHRIAEPESIDMTDQEIYLRIVDEIEQCRDSLKTIYDDAAEELKLRDVADEYATNGDTEHESRDASIDESALKPIIEQIATNASAGVDELDQAVESQIEDLVAAFIKAKQIAKTRVRDIWRARGRIALRLAVVMLSIGATLWTAGNFLPQVTFENLWASLPDWMIQGVLSSIATSLALSVCVFVVIGFTNANLRVAFRWTTLSALGWVHCGENTRENFAELV